MSKHENPHAGPSFESWLEEEGIADEVNDRALSTLLALQLDEARKAKRLTKSGMARRMKTTRTELDRLLGGENTTLRTVQKAARAVGKVVRLELVDFSKPQSNGAGQTAGGPVRRKTSRPKDSRAKPPLAQ